MFCDYSKLVKLYKISQGHFRLLGTNGFQAKAKNERFTAESSRCSQNLKNENFSTSKKLHQKARDHFSYSTNQIIGLWRCRCVAFYLYPRPLGYLSGNMADKKVELAMKKAEELDKELDEHIELLKKKCGGKKRETGFTEENWEQVSYQTRGWMV